MHIDPLALARFRDAETHQLTTYDLDKMKKVPVDRGQKVVLGYAESYTLLAAAAAYYAWTGLRFVQGRASLLWPTLGLGLAVALHLMALSLVLSWLYLLWRDQGNLGVWIRNPRIYLPCLAAGAVVAVAGYEISYASSHLPLYQIIEPGRYPILSLAHLGNLANVALLISPFGLIWGIVFYRRATWMPTGHFFAWAALGSVGLMVIHDAFFGGRDWDLLSFPGLFCTLWGLSALTSLAATASDAVRSFPGVCCR